jgi:phenylacetate-coenzyme A ligase PaaK-like adenylate-forming protein
MSRRFPERAFNLQDQEDFYCLLLEIFRYQSENNPVYNQFLYGLGRDKKRINNPSDIPFLPVEFFRNRDVVAGNLPPETVFESSRTTGTLPSRHLVHDLRVYETSFLKTFRLFYGDPSEWLIAALLPSYTERKNSSLVYMVDNLISRSHVPGSGFYRDNPDELIRVLMKAKAGTNKIMLFGVSFALLDLAEKYSPDFSGIIVMETGGMKGRRKEITREELHSVLKEKMNIPCVHSEYGMTELLSQAYSKGNGIFYCPPWMKILIRDPQDPLTILQEPGRTGGINIIDLANVWSCPFIATGDLGKLQSDGGFEVLGRFDNSDIRGCNLMAG